MTGVNITTAFTLKDVTQHASEAPLLAAQSLRDLVRHADGGYHKALRQWLAAAMAIHDNLSCSATDLREFHESLFAKQKFPFHPRENKQLAAVLMFVLTHAHQIRRWTRGQFFVTAPESVASTFGRSGFSSFHRASKTHAGLMNRKTIAAGFSSMTRQHVGRLEGVVIAALDELENNIRAQLDPSVAAAFAAVDDRLPEEKDTYAVVK